MKSFGSLLRCRPAGCHRGGHRTFCFRTGSRLDRVSAGSAGSQPAAATKWRQSLVTGDRPIRRRSQCRNQPNRYGARLLIQAAPRIAHVRGTSLRPTVPRMVLGASAPQPAQSPILRACPFLRVPAHCGTENPCPADRSFQCSLASSSGSTSTGDSDLSSSSIISKTNSLGDSAHIISPVLIARLSWRVVPYRVGSYRVNLGSRRLRASIRATSC